MRMAPPLSPHTPPYPPPPMVSSSKINEVDDNQVKKKLHSEKSGNQAKLAKKREKKLSDTKLYARLVRQLYGPMPNKDMPGPSPLSVIQVGAENTMSKESSKKSIPDSTQPLETLSDVTLRPPEMDAWVERSVNANPAVLMPPPRESSNQLNFLNDYNYSTYLCCLLFNFVS